MFRFIQRSDLAVLRLFQHYLFVVSVAGVLAVAPLRGTAQELRLAADRPLTLVDADGRLVRTTDFAGKWLLVYFGYTHCADLCPTGLTALANALDQIGPAASHVQPLFVTVDPERDKGPLLRSFAQSFDPRLIGLGGTLEQVKAAATTLGVSFEKVAQGGTDYVVDHSSTYVLIDPAHTRAETLRIAEPHMIAAKLIEALTKAGVSLDNVRNVGAYR
jgi:cytochrome oxidase Cu insertion factor (SCO1/SenC/PrrC family)